jgi:hypothetical protein
MNARPERRSRKDEAMTDNRTPSGWVGWGIFAATIMVIGGIFDIIYGISALIGPDTLVVSGQTGLFAINVQGWGWWHVAFGTLLLITGLVLYTGATWARVVAIIIASLNALVQLSLIMVQPWWSMIIIVLDVLVIYALTVHGRELKSLNDY